MPDAPAPVIPLIVVEDDDAALACRAFCGTWEVALLTCPWHTLRGRRVLLWPNQHTAQQEVWEGLARACDSLCERESKQLLTDQSPADVAAQGWDFKTFHDWARKRATRLPADNGYVTAAAGAVAVASVTVNAPPPDPARAEAIELWARLGLVLSNDRPIPNVDNAVRVLTQHPPYAEAFWYDTFHHQVFVTWPEQFTRAWEDWDTVRLQVELQRLGLVRLGKEATFDAVLHAAKSHARCVTTDWLRTLSWDNQGRCTTWLSAYLGAADTPYARAVGRNWWISLIARMRQPGCQQDHMLVLEGPQGIRKSSSLAAIGGPWYAAVTHSMNSEAFIESIQGKILIEIADLDAIRGAEFSRINAVITCRSDRFRPKYGRCAEDHARACVFVGTTNEHEWIRDHTGARRFWPVLTTRIDLDALARDRDQLFAEADHWFAEREPWHVVPEEATRQEQEARQVSDAWEDIFAAALALKEEVMVGELGNLLGFIPSRYGRGEQMRAGQCIRRLGWKPYRVYRNGRTVKVWRRSPPTTNEPDDPSSA